MKIFERRRCDTCNLKAAACCWWIQIGFKSKGRAGGTHSFTAAGHLSTSVFIGERRASRPVFVEVDPTAHRLFRRDLIVSCGRIVIETGGGQRPEGWVPAVVVPGPSLVTGFCGGRAPMSWLRQKPRVPTPSIGHSDAK